MKKSTPWLVAGLFAAGLLVVAAATTVARSSTPDLRRALDAQRLLVQESPYDARGFNDLGNLLTLAGADAEAEEAYRRAVELAPEATSPRYNLGLLLQNQRRHREALAEFNAVLDHDPRSAWARYQVGAIYEAQGDRARAIRWYGEAFSLDPQLVFPEYNPSVIDNGLVDEAMLQGYRYESSRTLAAKVYEEPRRIQSLMLPVPPEELETELTEEAGRGEDERAMSDREVLSSPVQPADPDTLDSGDLDRRRVNQAGAGGPSSRYGSTPQTRSQGRSWQRPPSVPQPGAASGRQPALQGGTVVVPGTVAPGQPRGPVGTRPADPTAPGTRVRTPRGRTGFTPGVSSTSRMELQLVPAGSDRRG